MTLLKCPNCPAQIRYNPQLAAQVVVCPSCRKPFRMPAIAVPVNVQIETAPASSGPTVSLVVPLTQSPAGAPNPIRQFKRQPRQRPRFTRTVLILGLLLIVGAPLAFYLLHSPQILSASEADEKVGVCLDGRIQGLSYMEFGTLHPGLFFDDFDQKNKYHPEIKTLLKYQYSHVSDQDANSANVWVVLETSDPHTGITNHEEAVYNVTKFPTLGSWCITRLER